MTKKTILTANWDYIKSGACDINGNWYSTSSHSDGIPFWIDERVFIEFVVEKAREAGSSQKQIDALINRLQGKTLKEIAKERKCTEAAVKYSLFPNSRGEGGLLKRIAKYNGADFDELFKEVQEQKVKEEQRKNTLDSLALHSIESLDSVTKKTIIAYYEALLVVESTDCTERNKNERIRELVEQKLNGGFDEERFLFAKDFVAGLIEE